MLFNPRGFKARVVRGTGKQRLFTDWLEEKVKGGSLRFSFRLEDEGYVTDRITTRDVEGWTPRVPVVISAPTGSGKNRFIQTTLLRYALEKRTEGENDRILILSNRIALSRQSKRKFAERVVEYTGDYGCLERLDSLYTAEGSDKLCFNFGPVTVCSYHQLWEKRLLDYHHYKYVVCDECHFFTSDATFNPNTDAILRYIVSSCRRSVRVYMSATIDTVIEPIIREEYRHIEEEVKRVEEGCRSYYDNPIVRFNAQVALAGSPYSVDGVHTSTIESAIRRYREEHGLTIQMYHMHRSYPQIDSMYRFSYMNEMVSKVLADKDRSHKWLFFVSDSKIGERVSADFNKNDRKSTFLSRKRVDSMEDVKKAYDSIVSNEYFKDDVLVSTSLLDNGINLGKCPNGDRVIGVVIDSFKKDQFIQMLGRVRVGEGERFNLYVRSMDRDEMARIVVKGLDDLVRRLRTDQEDTGTKKRFYDKELFRFTSDDEGFFTYNQLAILQLCTNAIPLLKCLTVGDKPPDIHCSTIELDACRTKAIEYYDSGKGRMNPYAGLIVSILQLKVPEPTYGTPADFQGYLESRLIPQYVDRMVEEKVEKLSNLCPEAADELYWEGVDRPDPLGSSALDRLQRLVSILAKHGVHVTTPEEEHYSGIVDYYQDYGFRNLGVTMDSINVQEEWLKRNHDSSPKVEVLKSKGE